MNTCLRTDMLTDQYLPDPIYPSDSHVKHQNIAGRSCLMKILPVGVLVFGLFLFPGGSYAVADTSAPNLLHQALEAQGGEQKLRSLKSVQWEASGYRNEPEESERPEGPYITDFLSVSEVHDLAGNRFRNVTDTSVYPFYKSSAVLVVNGKVAMRSVGTQLLAGTPQQVQITQERVALRRFPNQPIKAVVTTSDSWPHLAGIREYVADGIPIYALDLNEPILNRVIAGSRISKPDALGRSPRKPQFDLVHDKKVFGTGANRLEIYPIHGETSERQMMVYFPEYKLLYGSDPFQRRQDGSFFYPQTVTQLMDAVAREHLNVDRFFMMHIGPTAYPRQNSLALALRELGRIERTLFTLEWLRAGPGSDRSKPARS
jgi:hypothetical protein